jgi:hypothetical protein
MVVRAGDARIPVGNVVILADECGAATLTQDLGEHRGALGNLPAISRVAVAHFRNDSGTGGVVVAAGEQGLHGARSATMDRAVEMSPQRERTRH